MEASTVTVGEHADKKPKLTIFERFFENTGAVNKLKNGLDYLRRSSSAAILSLTINQCNAAYSKFGKTGKSFSEADVDAKRNLGSEDDIFAFSTIFRHGSEILNKYLKTGTAPEDRIMRILLSKLFEFILDKDNDKSLKFFSKSVAKHELVTVYAEHFFSRLGISSSYILDKYSVKEKTCTCGCGKDMENAYGDTSIGSVKAWHGQMDIILDGCDLAVVVSNTPRSPEVIVRSCLESPRIESQIFAQAIVFSFAQKKRHPENSNYLIPSIAVSDRHIIFIFYDCQHDILLRSPTFALLDAEKELSIVFILTAWFVINYKYFSSGIPSEYIKNVRKAKFFEHADCLLPVYQNELMVCRDIKNEKMESWELESSNVIHCNLVTLDEDEECNLVIPPNKKRK